MTTQFEISLARLTLRPPASSDAMRITQLIGHKDVVWNLGRAPYPYQLKDAEEWVAKAKQSAQDGEEYSFLITHADEGVIGCVSVTRHGDVWELGYWVGKPYWGQGFVTEAAIGILKWAQDNLSATGFVAGHYVDNPASGKVLEKLGFNPVGTAHLFARARGCDVLSMRYVRGAPDAAAMVLDHH